ncbi:TonB dependent receptor [compost metagenome]
MTVRDASFLRLKNLNFNYEVFSKGKAINRLNIFLAMENLATWTSYKGYDPDASATDKSSVSKVSYNSYPLARTIRLGINLTL